MEKTNKYYKIIENLVKQNNKFEGYESILDDIIDDVYSHSEVVLNSISNEDVIKAYLNKVVSTSIITVPKKLNFHKELSHAVINKDLNFNITSNQIKKTDINTALVDKMINGTKSENNEPVLKKEESINEFVIDKVVNENEIKLEDNLVSNDVAENLHISEDANIEDSSNILEDLSLESNTNSDIELADNIKDDISLENNTENDILTTENQPIETETVEESIEIDDSTIELNIETQDNSQEISNTIEESVQNEDTLLEDNIIDLSTANNEIEPQENELEQDLLIENEQTEIIEDTNSIEGNIVLSENVENILQAEDDTQEALIIEATNNFIDSTSLLEEDTSEDSIIDINEDSELINVEQDDISNEDLLLNLEDHNEELTNSIDISSNIDTLDSDISDINIDIAEELNSNEDDNKISNENIKVPDYSVFSYKSDKEAEIIDAEDIKKDIIEINDKFPQLKIIDVYNLKYKENYSINEIASKLSMDENKVIDSLNEILSVI